MLPNGDQARIDLTKLTDYVLDANHRIGRNKARVFQAALGLGREDAPVLLQALSVAAKTEPANLLRQDSHGAHYAIEFMMRNRDRQRRIRSLWTIRVGESFPRFVSAFVAKGDPADG